MPLRIRTSKSFIGLVRQPGCKIKEKQDGSIEGYLILDGDASNRGMRPGINDSHPDDSRALCYDVETETLKSGKIRVVAAYIGVQMDPTPWFQSGAGSFDRPSITTHPDFVSKLGGTPSAPLNKCQFDPDTGDFVCFPPDAGNNLAGVSEWHVPMVVWRFTRWSEKLFKPRRIRSEDFWSRA